MTQLIFHSVHILDSSPEKLSNERANTVDPDETAHNEPSHSDLQCFPSNVDFST